MIRAAAAFVSGLALSACAMAQDPHHPDLFDEAYTDAVIAHVEASFGVQIETVIHETASHTVHIDILPVPPSDERPYWTFITAGMGAKPMTMPEGFEDFYSHAELAILLPADWMTEEDLRSALPSVGDRIPLADMRRLATYPHLADTWLGPGHTVKWEGYADDSPVKAYLIDHLEAVPIASVLIDMPGGRRLNILTAIPIHQGERAFAIDRGSEALIDLLRAKESPLIWTTDRAPVVPVN